jgi:putative DNA primase/helicase
MRRLRAVDSAALDDDELRGLDDIVLGEPDPESGRLVLSPKRTLPTAEAYVREFHQHRGGGRTLHNYHGTLIAHRGNQYVQIEDASIKHDLQPWLHRAVRIQFNPRTEEKKIVDFESNPATVNQALEAIRNHVHLPAAEFEPPCWLDERTDPPPHELIPCRNGNLHVPTGRLLPPDPALFVTSAVNFDYDAKAPYPEHWHTFLGGLFYDDDAAKYDTQAIELLQEWFGHSLTPDTSLQKMLFLVGPTRSGKGTIGRILRAMVGPGNVANPTTASLAGAFGLQPLIGKPLAIVSDARFSGESTPIVIERLLNISGEDPVTIDRKFLASIHIKLPTRFVFLSNELPRLADSSTAIAGRFLVIRLTKSYFGKEDVKLTEKLLTELPGILLWAIQGWKRLRERGRFVQPASAEDAVREIKDLASPVGAFVREQCVVGAGRRVDTADLYRAWKQWCEQHGRDKPGSEQSFGRNLRSAVPGVKTRQADSRFYEGIGLRGAS